jgi:hypothetical protein
MSGRTMTMIIAIDFDGTCVTHEYPHVGEEIGAVPILKKLVFMGHQLILFTMRCNKELDEAVDWFKSHDILLYGINENPEQSAWTQSPKPFAHLYIDDSGLGIPLKHDYETCQRPYVDWEIVAGILKERKLIL